MVHVRLRLPGRMRGLRGLVYRSIDDSASQETQCDLAFLVQMRLNGKRSVRGVCTSDGAVSLLAIEAPSVLRVALSGST
jgi:hypothetical protein